MNVLSISRFWNKFSSKSKQYGVKADAILWMVKHAVRYIKSYPDDKLVHHKSEFFTQYLKEKYHNPLLLGWQFRWRLKYYSLKWCKRVGQISFLG